MHSSGVRFIAVGEKKERKSLPSWRLQVDVLGTHKTIQGKRRYRRVKKVEVMDMAHTNAEGRRAEENERI